MLKKNVRYVDGMVVPVPKKQVAAYKKMSKAAGKIWLELGAVDYVECVADDVKKGKVTSFPQAVKLKKGEVVFFSFITYKSKDDRKRVMKLIMKDKRIEKLMAKGMPFDGKRMFWGGFEPLVNM